MLEFAGVLRETEHRKPAVAPGRTDFDGISLQAAAGFCRRANVALTAIFAAMEGARAISADDALLAGVARAVAEQTAGGAVLVRAAQFGAVMVRTREADVTITGSHTLRTFVRARITHAALRTAEGIGTGNDVLAGVVPTALSIRAVRISGALEALMKCGVAGGIRRARAIGGCLAGNARHALPRSAALASRALSIE